MIKKIAILCSIFLNLCIVRWEPVAIRMTWEAVGSQTFTFYTENSNVFCVLRLPAGGGVSGDLPVHGAAAAPLGQDAQVTLPPAA